MSDPLLTATEVKAEIDNRSNLYDEPTRSAFLLGAVWGAQTVRKKMEALAQPAQAGQGTKVKEPHFAPQEAITEDGWTEWVCPKPKGYLAQCCDCGLVHEIDTRVAKYEPRPSENFEVVTDPDLQVQWRVRRRDDLRQEIWEIPAFEPDQAPDLEAGKSRFYSSQAGQAQDLMALIDRYWELAYAEGKGGRDHDTVDGAAADCRRAIEAAVLAKRVPMTDEQVTAAFVREPTAMSRHDFTQGIRYAEVWHGIVGEKGGA